MGDMAMDPPVEATFVLCICASFHDVTTENRFHRPVAFAVGNNLMIGYSDTKFAPQDKATRAQVATILMRLELLNNRK